MDHSAQMAEYFIKIQVKLPVSFHFYMQIYKYSCNLKVTLFIFLFSFQTYLNLLSNHSTKSSIKCFYFLLHFELLPVFFLVLQISVTRERASGTMARSMSQSRGFPARPGTVSTPMLTSASLQYFPVCRGERTTAGTLGLRKTSHGATQQII